MNWDFILISCYNLAICIFLISQKVGVISFSQRIFTPGLYFGLCLKHIHVIHIVKVFSIESTEHNHIATNERCTVSPSCLRNLRISLHSFHLLTFQIYDQNVAQIIAKPSAKDINLVFINTRAVTPACKECIALYLALSPSQSKVPIFQQFSHIHWINVVQTSILSMTACNYKEFVANFHWRMKSPCTRLWAVLL